MSQPKTTIDLPFSPEDVRMGRHLGNAIAGYRDGDFKRSAEGMVDAVRAFQAAVDELDRLKAEVAEVAELRKVLANLYYDGDPVSREAAWSLLNQVVQPCPPSNLGNPVPIPVPPTTGNEAQFQQAQDAQPGEEE